MEEIRAEIQATKTRLEELQRKQNTLLELQKKELEKGVPLVVPIYDIYKELVYCKKSSYDETTLTLKKGDRAIIEICLWGNQDGTDLDFKFDLTPLGIQYSETNSTDDGGAYRVKPWFTSRHLLFIDKFWDEIEDDLEDYTIESPCTDDTGTLVYNRESKSTIDGIRITEGILDDIKEIKQVAGSQYKALLEMIETFEKVCIKERMWTEEGVLMGRLFGACPEEY